uniref:Uncharacterized protein n=1 Tax=Arundo donax TaxID=35708 RepID=A0A0A9FNI4_ARUDO
MASILCSNSWCSGQLSLVRLEKRKEQNTNTSAGLDNL